MRFIPLLSVLAIAAAVAAPAAHAADSKEIYAGVGTTGITAGYGYALGEHSGLRVEANYLKYSRDFNSHDAKYNGQLKFADVGAYYDYFFAGPFRVTGGLLIGQSQLTGDGKAVGGSITINHLQYDATGQWVRAKAKYSTVRPYLGLGWGHRPDHSGLGFFGDVGVAYGSPDVSFHVSDGLQAEAGQANIDAERRSVQNKADDLKWYPVVRVGLDYTF